MKNTDIIIIGAGAAGLMAAYELSKSGKKVCVLEARTHVGGRMHTLNDGWATELGAEFVHGDLPVTLQLLKEAQIDTVPASGEMWHFSAGKFSKDSPQMKHWGLLMEKLNKLEDDISIGDFLQKEFGGDRYAGLRKSVTKFVSGYDTADILKASAFALRREWQGEDDDAQHRVKGGYGQMINYLQEQSKKNGAEIHLNTIAKRVHWTHGQVEVITKDQVSYKAAQLIIALPLGILKADPSEAATVSISPSVSRYQQAIDDIGFGAIVKLLLQFKSAFWLDISVTGADLAQMSFILSGEEIPTWWTQHPACSTLLTGWLGGPAAERKKNLGNEELLQQGIQSLAHIFKRSPEKLAGELVSWNVVNWTTDPFTLGSYAYDTLQSSQARKVLNTPINYTIYFAGEYLYDGPAMGTVEAALTSGLETARKMID
jgi:monoamine oxidase